VKYLKLEKMTEKYQLRPATMEDREFMMHLEKVNFEKFPTVMELFSEEHQKNQYENFFKPKHVSIIEYENRPIGAQSVIVHKRNLFIIYLYLLPEFHNRGIDESLIKIALKQAMEEKKTVISCVFKEDTQGKNTYDALGFKSFAEDDLRWRVKWDPA
jgi:ribosomal protein S18 acetylase RimI-like enzyme